MRTPMLIYKIFRKPEWVSFQNAGVTEGAPIDLRDGFIHFSTRDQVEETAALHFVGAADLVVLACDAAALGPALKWETSRGGAAFPHLYRALDIGDVAWARPLPLVEGVHVFPDHDAPRLADDTKGQR